eukprot:scaffold32427_cov112-Isochrysis_galbana.AAC.3
MVRWHSNLSTHLHGFALTFFLLNHHCDAPPNPHHLQTRILLHGSPDSGGPSFLRRSGTPHLDAAERSSLYALLSDPAHLTFPLDRLDQALLLLSARTGFVNPGYTFARPKSRRWEGSGLTQAGAGAALTRGTGTDSTTMGSGGGAIGGAADDVCAAPATPPHGGCLAAIAAHAPEDVWLYRQASRLFSERFRLFSDSHPDSAVRAAAMPELFRALATEQEPATRADEEPRAPPHRCRGGGREGALSLARCNDAALRYAVLPSLSRKAGRAGRRRRRRAGSEEL